MKVCSKCKELKEFTEFGINNATPDKLSYYCRDCLKAKGLVKSAKITAKRLLKHPLPPEGFKRCRKCKEEKELSNFTLSGTTGKYHPRCRECLNADSRARHKANPERHNEYAKTYYRKNVEKHYERTQEYFKNNPDKTKAYKVKFRSVPENAEHERSMSRKYYHEHKEERRDYDRKYRLENPLKHRIKGQRRRTRLLGLPGYHTEADIEDHYTEQLGKCVYCGCSLRHSFSIDHIIPVSREGSSNYAYNLQLLCGSCNSSKRDRTHEEYLEYLRSKEKHNVLD